MRRLERGWCRVLNVIDLGQQLMIIPPDGTENEVTTVKAAVVSQSDVDMMMKKSSKAIKVEKLILQYQS